MDSTTVLERVREENRTALDRLGSEKALVATTDARLDRRTVLGTAAAGEARAAGTFEAWAEDANAAALESIFDDVAATERDHLDRIVALADEQLPAAEESPDALHTYLRELSDTPARLGAGLVGRPLVASGTLLQVINFFVNEGEDAAADCFRELRSETDEQAATGSELAVRHCEDDLARERALEAAGEAIDVAYEEYVDHLTEMGVDPKPVC